MALLYNLESHHEYQFYLHLLSQNTYKEYGLSVVNHFVFISKTANKYHKQVTNCTLTQSLANTINIPHLNTLLSISNLSISPPESLNDMAPIFSFACVSLVAPGIATTVLS